MSNFLTIFVPVEIYRNALKYFNQFETNAILARKIYFYFNKQYILKAQVAF